MTDDLEDLLCLLDEARVVDRFRQLDMTKVTRALRHVLAARLAFELPIYGAEQRVVETAITRLHSALVHRLGVEDVGHTHILDLLRRQETELNLLDRLQRRTRVREIEVRHLYGCRR